jgi:hypothetical protein
MVDGGFVEPVYDVVQLPDDNVQEEGLNVPPPLLSFHDIVPTGVLGELDVSVTVAVNVTDDPEFITDELGEMLTVVGSGVLETDVLLLLVNIKLLLSAITGRMITLPKNDEHNMKVTSKSMFKIFFTFGLPDIFNLSLILSCCFFIHLVH